MLAKVPWPFCIGARKCVLPENLPLDDISKFAVNVAPLRLPPHPALSP